MSARVDKAINLALLQLAQGGALFAASLGLATAAVAVPWACCLFQVAIGRARRRDLELLLAGVVIGTAAEWLAVGAGAISFTNAPAGWAIALWVPPTWGMLGLSVPRILSFLRGRPFASLILGSIATAGLLAGAAGSGEVDALSYVSLGFTTLCLWLGAALALVIHVGARLGRRQ